MRRFRRPLAATLTAGFTLTAFAVAGSAPAGAATAPPGTGDVMYRWGGASLHAVVRTPYAELGLKGTVVVLDLAVSRRAPVSTVQGSAVAYDCPEKLEPGADPATTPGCTRDQARYVDQRVATTLPDGRSLRLAATLTLTDGPYGVGGAVATLPVDLTWSGKGTADRLVDRQHIEDTVQTRELVRPAEKRNVTVTGSVGKLALASAVTSPQVSLWLGPAFLSTSTVTPGHVEVPAVGPAGANQVSGLTGTVRWQKRVLAVTMLNSVPPFQATEVGNLVVKDEGSAGRTVTGSISWQRCATGQTLYVEGTAPTASTCTVVLRTHVAEGAKVTVTSDTTSGIQTVRGSLPLVVDGSFLGVVAHKTLEVALRTAGRSSVYTSEVVADTGYHGYTGNHWATADVTGKLDGRGLHSGKYAASSGGVLAYLRFPAE